MEKVILPSPDKNGIIKALPCELKDFDATWKKISDKRGLHFFTEEGIEQVCSHNGLTYTPYDTNGGVLYFQAQKAK